jgi:molecular chaperone DnaK
MLSDKYGPGKIKVSEKPMLAIAEGAAILSHRLGDEFEATIQNSTAIGEISYSTNHNYFLQIAEDNGFKMERVIEKQTPLPVETAKNFKTTTNNQKIAKVSIHADIENGEFKEELIGFYLIDDNLPIGSELTFEFNLDLNEIFTVTVYPKGKKALAKNIILGRNYADQKALQTIDELIALSVKEYKTVDGEEAFLKYISQKIKEIDSKGATEIEDNKWHEIYYTTTEKYDEIKNSEQLSSDVENSVLRAKRLINEFSDLLDLFDKTAITNLINQIESSGDETEKMELAETLETKTDNYGLLNSALRIESFAERILNIPTTQIGGTNKQTDVTRLKQLGIDVRTKFKMHQIEPAKALMNEAYEIIDKYKQFL